MAMWNLWRGCKKCSEGCLHCYIHKGDAKRGVDTSHTDESTSTDKNENYQENCYKIVVHRSDGTSTEYLLVGSRLIDQNTQQEFPVSEDTMKDLKNALGIPLN